MTQYNVQFQDGNGSLAGLRNQLINSNFNINQRGATSITVAANTTDYFVDRWAVQPSAQNPGVGTTISIGGETNSSLPWSWTIAIDGNSVVFQQVEFEKPGRQTVFTIGSTWTLSVYANIDVTSFSPSLVFSAPVLANRVTAAAATPFVLIESAVSGSAYNRYAATFTITGDVNSSANVNSINALTVPIANGAVTGAGNIALPQFEPGPIATPFEDRPIALELSLCQRYYQTFGSGALGAQNANLNNYAFGGGFLVEMRTSPTVSIFDSSIFLAGVFSTGTSATPAADIGTVTVTGINLLTASSSGINRCRANLSSAVTGGVVYASTTDFLSCDAEL